MDNPTRSERSRQTAIQAALVILTRDGVGALTFDALARESGISKGGLLHQFRTKSGIIKALLEYQTQHFQQFATDYLSSKAASATEPTLSAQIAVSREAMKQPHPVARAVLAALVEDATLLEMIRTTDVPNIKTIEKEATDPDMALVRWAAAKGLAFNALLGLCPLSDKQRDRLFERLLDDDKWKSVASPKNSKAKAKKPSQ
ncbi:TetR/AcrR family transcriptional regulator [Paraburkholderia sp.]|uniref:TetR/AcrR family transcriptional regulator n=1 Tax=Paraburkholderia sp. TaxID=1926495 RepID=UPI003D6E599E